MLLNRKPGFYVAVVRRLPNGLGMKAPRDHSGKSPELLSPFPNETSIDNLRSYYRVWSKRRTSFINYGCVNTSSCVQKRWSHFDSVHTSPAAMSDDVPTLGSDDEDSSGGLSPYDTTSYKSNSGVNNNRNNGKEGSQPLPPSSSSSAARVSSSSSTGATLGLLEVNEKQQRHGQRSVAADNDDSKQKQKKSFMLSSSPSTTSSSLPSMPSSASASSSSPSGKFTTAALHKKHQQNIPITMVTAYDYPSAQIADTFDLLSSYHVLLIVTLTDLLFQFQ